MHVHHFEQCLGHGECYVMIFPTGLLLGLLSIDAIYPPYLIAPRVRVLLTVSVSPSLDCKLLEGRGENDVQPYAESPTPPHSLGPAPPCPHPPTPPSMRRSWLFCGTT